MATTETTIKPIVAKSPRSGALVMLGKAFSLPEYPGALLVAGVFMNLCVRLQNDASLPTSHWHASFVASVPPQLWYIHFVHRGVDRWGSHFLARS